VFLPLDLPFSCLSGIKTRLQSQSERSFGALRLLFSFSWPQQREARRHPVRRSWKEYRMSIQGTVKFFNATKGYGFIAPDTGGQDAFVHITAVERAGLATLNQDQRVSYELETDRRGKTSAVNLQSI
jgi:CspA family cold shock protein